MGWSHHQVSQGNKLKERLSKKRKDRESQLVREHADAEAVKVLTYSFRACTVCIRPAGSECLVFLGVLSSRVHHVCMFVVPTSRPCNSEEGRHLRRVVEGPQGEDSFCVTPRSELPSWRGEYFGYELQVSL